MHKKEHKMIMLSNRTYENKKDKNAKGNKQINKWDYYSQRVNNKDLGVMKMWW